MNTTADPSATQPGSLAHWLAGHAELGSDALTGLVALIEPLGSQAAIKTVANGRYVFASTGLAQMFEREAVVGHTDAELLTPEETTALRRVEQTVMAQRLPVASEHKLEINGRRREFSVTRLALGQEFLLSVWHERTEERHRESHLQRALAQIEQQQSAIEQIRRELQLGSGRDDVSGLYLRPQFDDQLLREIDDAHRCGRRPQSVEHRIAPLSHGCPPSPAAQQPAACRRPAVRAWQLRQATPGVHPDRRESQ